MSNYPNMSYCMCENTAAALAQVINAMREEGPEFLRDLNRSEQRAFRDLFNICEDFMQLSEVLEDEYQQELGHDGQPDEAQEWHDFDPEC